MTSIQNRFAFSQPVTMPDDNMEITSEHEEQDIDIDLDLPQNHHDDDEVLEDAKSDAGLDEDYDIDLGSSPVLAHDDLMLDEENPSFAMNDASDEIAQTETIDFGNLSAFNQIAIDFNGTYNDAALLPSNVNDIPEAHWEQVQEDDNSAGASNTEFEQQEGGGSQEETENEQKVEQSRRSRTSPPASLLAESNIFTEVSGKDALSQPELTPKSLTESQEGKVSKVSKPEVAENDTGDADKVDSEQIADSGSGSVTARGVIVRYRHLDYSLVASSELDDPDSYFLKDDSLTSAPLSEFLLALREVISEDLASDDELCLAIDDFGVEINETSTLTFQMTFANIIDLHASLLRNDGINAPGPLIISLCTKPDFSKRLASLAAGAVEGKGLSELFPWDEESDSFQEEHSEFVEDGLVPVEDHVEEEPFPNDTNGSQNGETRQDLTSQNNLEEANGSAEIAGSSGRVVDHELAEHSDIPAGDEVATSLEPVEGEEEEDLIDYEDEDFEQTRPTSVSAHSLTDHNGIDTAPICLKPAACFCPACTEAIVAEYEEINEDLSRRSLSRAAEESEEGEPSGFNQGGAAHSDTFQEPFTEKAGLPGRAIADENNTFEDNEVISYEEQIDMQENGVRARDQDAQDDGNDEIPPLTDDPTHEQHQADNVSTSFDFPAEKTSLHQSDEADVNEYFDFNGEEDLDVETLHEEHVYHGGQIGDPRADNPGLVESGINDDEINYEDVDEAPGSNESEQTLVPDDAGAAQNDEIDYEDDDEPTETDVSQPRPTSPAAPVPNGVTSKRPRADGEDVVDGELQDTKRLRS